MLPPPPPGLSIGTWGPMNPPCDVFPPAGEGYLGIMYGTSLEITIRL